MAFDELFKVGLRFAEKRRRELCAAAALSREPVRAEEARRYGGVLGRLAPWLRCQDVAALDERSVRIPCQYLPRSNDFRAREVGSGSSRQLTRRSYLAAVQQLVLPRFSSSVCFGAF